MGSHVRGRSPSGGDHAPRGTSANGLAWWPATEWRKTPSRAVSSVADCRKPLACTSQSVNKDASSRASRAVSSAVQRGTSGPMAQLASVR